MKKFFLICAALAGAVCLTLGLAACGESGGEATSAHEHNWSDEWTANEGYHWHECLAGGCTVTADSAKSGYAAHTDEDNDGYCDVCGYDIGVEGGNETVLSYITANFNQGENVIYTSAALDDLKTYLTVTGTNRDHSSAGTITGYTLSGELTAGTSTVTIAYNGLYTTFTVEVTAVELISISAAYEQGDTVIYPNTDMYEYYDDITVTGVNNDGSSCELEDGYEFDYDFTEGECEVTVYYLLADWNSGNFSYLTAAFTVNVSAVYIVGLAIEYYSFNDSEALYYAGVAWAGDSLADVYFDCVVSYNDDSYQYIGWDDEDGFELSLGNGTDILEEGENSITVTYNGYSETVTVVASVRSLDYSLNSDNASYTVTGLGSIINGDIVILATYNNFPVTAIGDMAFSENTILTSVTIPDSVISIGISAFLDCENLSNVTIGSGVKTIGDDAFRACTSLESITIPDSVTEISSTAFYNCSNLSYNEYDNAYYLGNDSNLYVVLVKATSTDITSCTVHEDTKFIYGSAFSGCTSLESVTIGSGVTSIGDSAFSGCTNLTSIVIPDSVTSIAGYAFRYCTNLGSVTIGSGVTSIGSEAFNGCYYLTKIYYNATECADVWSGGTVFDYAGRYGNGIAVTIGANVVSIPAYLFCHGAFSDAPNIVNVEFAEGSVCESIGEHAFSDCTSLTSITIPGSVETIGEYAFYGCSDASIKAEGAITELGDYAFYNCAGLQSITLGEGLTSIGSYAFCNCTGLTEINYNATECADLSANNYVFYNAGKSGEGITVYIGANVKSIPNYLFYSGGTSYAPKIVSVEFAEGSVCESIGNNAFLGCTSLTSITIPDNVTSIGSGAFMDCTSLISVTIGSGVTSIGRQAFADCHYLTEIYYNATECADMSEYDYVFSYAGQNGGGITVYIGANVTSIPAHLFYAGSTVTSVAPKLVIVVFTEGSVCESIGNSAFSKCSSLTTVYYGGSSNGWSTITIGSNNTYLTNATRYYYSEEEPALTEDGTAYDGNYWHYVKGEIKIWGDDE